MFCPAIFLAHRPTKMNSVSTGKPPKRKMHRKYWIWAVVGLCALALSFFLVTFVMVPLIFMWSVDLQASYMFPADTTSRPDFNDFERYGIDGVRNFYVNVMDENRTAVIRLGVWHVLPEYYNHGDLTFDGALDAGKFDVIIYFHGSRLLRHNHTEIYKLLRKYFHVIAMDYRGYGDSSRGKLSEGALTSDLQQLYKWVRTRTRANIYVWGHSLGAALSTRTVALLGEQYIVPMGLVLEAPFTSVKDVIYYHPAVQMFTWLPWFEATFLRPLEDNDMAFRSEEDILNVKCPVMVLHAEDDALIPYSLGRRLAEIAGERRNVGNVTYHQFSAKFGYGHLYIHEAPELGTLIANFNKICAAFNLGRG